MSTTASLTLKKKKKGRIKKKCTGLKAATAEAAAAAAAPQWQPVNEDGLRNVAEEKSYCKHHFKFCLTWINRMTISTWRYTGKCFLFLFFVKRFGPCFPSGVLKNTIVYKHPIHSLIQLTFNNYVNFFFPSKLNLKCWVSSVGVVAAGQVQILDVSLAKVSYEFAHYIHLSECQGHKLRLSVSSSQKLKV